MSNIGVETKNTEAEVTKTENAIRALNDEMDKNQRAAKESGTAYNSLKSTISEQN